MIKCPNCGNEKDFQFVNLYSLVFTTDIHNNLEPIETTGKTQKIKTNTIICKKCEHNVKLIEDKEELVQYKLKDLELLALKKMIEIL